MEGTWSRHPEWTTRRAAASQRTYIAWMNRRHLPATALLLFAGTAPLYTAAAQGILPPVWERRVEMPLRPVEGGPAHLAGPGPAPPPPELTGRDRNPSVWRHLVGRRDLPIPEAELNVLAERDRAERQGRPTEPAGFVTPRSIGPAAPR